MQLGRVQHHPGQNGHRLPEDVLRRAEEPRRLLSHPTERVVAERTMQLRTLMLHLVHGFGCTTAGRHEWRVLDLAARSSARLGGQTRCTSPQDALVRSPEPPDNYARCGKGFWSY